MNSTSHDNLQKSVGRLCRAAYVVSLLVLCATCLLAVQVKFLEKSDRAWFLLIGSLPALLFVLAHFLLEARLPRTYFTRDFAASSGLTVGALLLPVSFVLLRHVLLSASAVDVGNYVMIAIVVALLASPLPIQDLPGVQKTYLRLFRHLKAVMWDVPTGPAAAGLVDGAQDEERIRAARRGQYSNHASLSVFQRSLSTPEFDAEMAVALVLETLRDRNVGDLSILDVGGGEGMFTARFLHGLQKHGHQIDRVVNVDPIDWAEEYAAAIKTAAPKASIECRVGTLDELRADTRFSIVLSSHSLYGACDGPMQSLHLRAADAVQRLQALSLPVGATAVIVASEAGNSYKFKSEALAWLFGGKVRDLVAEDLNAVAELRDAKTQRVDNIIDLSSPLAKAASGDTADIQLWLSYFLRVPPNMMSADVLDGLLGLLGQHTQPLHTLHESLIEKCSHLASHPARDATVLAHKVTVMVV